MDMHIHIPYHPYGDEDSTWILTASRESFISVFPKTTVREYYQCIFLQAAIYHPYLYGC